MQNQRNPGEIVRDRRKELGWSQTQLAKKVGSNQQTIGKIEKGQTKKSPLLPLIAVVLGIPIERLVPGVNALDPNQVARELPRYVLDSTQVRETVAGRRDLPLHSMVEAGSGALVMSSDPVDRIDRPDVLTFVKDAYAVIVVGDSMFPVLKAGYRVKVHPHTVPRPEDICLFIRDENGEFHATIKEYIGQTKDAWKVRRYHPKEETILLKKREWPRCDVVVGVDYR